MTGEPYYRDASVDLFAGDALEVLRGLGDRSVDAVVTDPPYGLAFMGKAWDTLSPRAFQAWSQDWARECLRVLKPGGHLLAFGGTRTSHRLACAIEDAGFEIRDSIAWLYGQGFPKSLDVGKAIDKEAGAERVSLGVMKGAASSRTESLGVFAPEYQATAPATPEAATWQGWGTALKPAFEPVVVGRKPLQGTVAGNVLAYGTGALNIDACRIEGPPSGLKPYTRSSMNGEWNPENLREGTMFAEGREVTFTDHPAGRWPANVVLDESQADELDRQSGELVSGANPTRRGSDKFRDAYGEFTGQEECTPARGIDVGGASRFFYTAKADAAERPRIAGVAHPTVKPLWVMRWLVRLVTPPGGLILDPFAGSGTTIEAAILEGFRCVAVEREVEYLPLCMARIHRRRDPIAALTLQAEDLGLFGGDDE